MVEEIGITEEKIIYFMDNQWGVQQIGYIIWWCYVNNQIISK